MSLHQCSPANYIAAAKLKAFATLKQKDPKLTKLEQAFRRRFLEQAEQK
jgi:hypothetical protein